VHQDATSGRAYEKQDQFLNTGKSFFTKDSEIPQQIKMSDFLPPVVKDSPARNMFYEHSGGFDAEKERRVIESALWEHQRTCTLLQQRRNQLEMCLKLWQGPNLQQVVDAFVMMSDINCAFDLLSATFAKGLRVTELTVVQKISLLKKLKELLDKTQVEH